MIFQFSLPGDIFDDDLVGFQVAVFADDFSAAEPDFQGRLILPLPFDFDGLNESIRAPLTQQLCSLARVLDP
jgi:hypothetical protein